MKFPSEIFGCGENERQSSEILNVIAPIALAAQCNGAKDVGDDDGDDGVVDDNGDDGQQTL